jgi:probable phosphoglycerate mutase
MVKIFLCRHGSTDWNADAAGGERFRGASDLALSSDGFAQAARLGDYFLERGLRFDACFCSPLRRAQQTATTILEHSGNTVPILTRPGLTSVQYGEWEGRLCSEIAANDPEKWRIFENHIHEMVFPGGESLADLKLRAMPVLEECRGVTTGAPREPCVLVVTHQVVTRTLIPAILGCPDATPYWRLAQDTGCMNLITAAPVGEGVDPKWQLVEFNITK